MADPVRLSLRPQSPVVGTGNPYPVWGGFALPGDGTQGMGIVTLVDGNGNPISIINTANNVNAVNVKVVGFDIQQEILFELQKIRAAMQLLVTEYQIQTELTDAVVQLDIA